MTRLLTLFALLSLPLLGCPADDDDSAGDDDSAADDDATAADDDDSTAADDDDATADDDDDGEDLVAATVPSFDGGCTGNRFKAVLGDGTALAEVEGFLDAPASYANTQGNLAFRIRLGIDGTNADSTWVMVSGNRLGLDPQESTYALPHAGSATVLQAWVGTDLTGGPSPLAGPFGMPLVAHESVGGTLTFTQNLPEPGVNVVGTFEGILQGGTSSIEHPGRVITLGVGGCFTATLAQQNN